MSRTRTGLDSETLTKMEKFYEGVYLRAVGEFLEAAIIYHSDPTYRNFLAVFGKLQSCREDMIRRQVFATHNDPPCDPGLKGPVGPVGNSTVPVQVVNQDQAVEEYKQTNEFYNEVW